MKLSLNLSKPMLFLATAMILLIGMYFTNQILAKPDGQAQPSTNTAYTQKNLSDCMKELEPKTAGWCELKVNAETPGISSVWPKKEGRIFQTVGPQAVLSAWGSAAYDKQAQTLYFMGGGGTDYGGNEVYSFALKSGQWQRLTNPSPLTYFARSDRTFWIPDTRKVPAATHIHDGLIFNPKTRTLVLLSHMPAIGARIRKNKPKDQYFISDGATPQQYEFNPSETETRNGLDPLSWRRIGTHHWSYPRSATLPDGSLVFGSKTALYKVAQTPNGQITVNKRIAKHGNYGPVHLTYDEKRKRLWLISKEIAAYSLNGKRVQRIRLPFQSPRAIAFDDQGHFVLWDGRTKIFTKDPDKANAPWSMADWRTEGPSQGSTGRLYGKWVAIGNNYFVGLSSHRTGVWVYKHSNDSPHKRNFSQASLKRIIKNAPTGGEIKLPAGLYGYGIKIPKALTVDMEGVEILNVYGGKAIVVVESNNGPVLIKNLRVNGKQTNATTGNLAGIRVSGKSFDVTIENAYITDTGLGIMSDNRGGKLTIKNSYLGNIGSGKRKGLSHIIYAGSIDELTVENSVFERPMRLGHVLKSRAKKTHIKNTRLLGLNGRHSRIVDFSCGGKLTIENSVLQNSANSDNSDLISVGVEQPGNCKRGLLPGNVSLQGNTIIFDRGLRDSDPERRKRLNRLFTWRSGVEQLNMNQNVIVSPGGDYILDQSIDGYSLSRFKTSNKVFVSRKQARVNPLINSSPLEN